MTRTETNAVIRSPYGIGTLLCTRRMAAALAVGMMLMAAAPALAGVNITGHPSSVTACEGNNASFGVTAVAAPLPGTLAYQWRRNTVNLTNGGAISGADTANLSISMVVFPGDNGAIFDVVVTDTTNGGSATSTPATLTVNPRPATPDGSATPNPICAGSSTDLVDAAPVAGVMVDWYADACGVTFIGTGTTSVSPGSTKTYYARARNSSTGCVSLVCDEVEVTVVPAPTANAGGAYTTCGLAPVTMAATATNFSSLLWTENGAGSFGATATTEDATYTPAAGDFGNTVTLTLTVTGNGPCTVPAVSTTTLSVQTPPSAVAGGPYSTCGTASLTVAATAANYSSLLWTHNGAGSFGATATTEDATYTPGAGDIGNTVTLTLTAQPIAPCATPAVSTASLFVQTPPSANAGPNSSTCGTTPFTVAATAANYSSLLWTHNGAGSFGATATTEDATYTPGAGDIGNTVTLTLTASPIAPCMTDAVSSASLFVQTPPSAVAGGPYSTCGTASLTVAATAANYSSLLWTHNGAGSFGATATTEDATYTPGAGDIGNTVTLTLTAQPIAPCATPAVSTASLFVQTPPSANAGPNSSTCGTTPFTVAATAANYSSLLWTHNGAGSFGATATTEDATYTPGAGDIGNTVTLTLTASPIAPCMTDAVSSASLFVQTPPSAVAGGPYSTCGTASLTVAATAANYSSLLWTHNGAGSFGATATTEDATYTPGAGDIGNTVTLTLTAQPIAPCATPAVSTASLFVQTPPSGSAGGPYDTCDLSPVPVIGTASNSSTVLWSSSGGGSFADPTLLSTTYTPHTDDVGDTLTLILTINGVGACAATQATPTTTLVVSETPECEITAAPTQVSPNSTGNTASILPVAGATSYAWTVTGSPGAMITAGQGTNSITYNAGNGTVVTLGVTVIVDAVVADPGYCECTDELGVNINTGGGALTLAFEPATELCYNCSDTLTATLRMSDLETPAAGFQAFLGYDTSILDFTGYTYTFDPFCLHMIDSPLTVEPIAGSLNFAGGIAHTGTPPDDLNCPDAQSPTLLPALLVTMTFDIIADDAMGDCTPSDLLYFRTSIPPTHLVDAFANPFNDLDTNAPQTITVDCDAPTVTPGSLAQCYINFENEADPAAAAQAAAEAAAIAATISSDVCGSVTEAAVTSGSDPCNATITVTATDCAGNPDSVVYTGIRLDPIPPTISCPPPVTVSCPEDVPDPDFAFGTFTAGSCGWAPEFVSDVPSAPPVGPGCQDYVITRTYRMSNGTANPCYNVQCTQTITVQDDDAPMITAPDDVTVSCANDPLVTTPANSVSTLEALTGGDVDENCLGAVTITHEDEKIAGSCDNRYTINRTYTATDECGNSASDVQVITVHDDDAPMITAPNDVTVSCADDSLVTTPANSVSTLEALTGGDVDENCPGAVTITHEDEEIAGSCDNRYTINRTYTATDECGNSASDVQVITVHDDDAPMITAPNDVTVSCADDSLVTTPANSVSTLEALTGGDVDENCPGAVTITHEDDEIAGSCDNRYTINRTYTATDECGNSASDVQVITVHDDDAPIITAPDDVTVSCADDSLVTTPANSVSTLEALTGGDVDENCPGAVTITHEDDEIAGSCDNRYTINRTYTATDECGNSASDVQVITVNDQTPPTFTVTCPRPPISVNADAGGCNASPATVNAIPPPAMDNCGAVTVTGVRSDFPLLLTDPYPQGSTTITWTATDACLQTATCTQLVVVSATNIIKVTIDLSPTIETTPTGWPANPNPPQDSYTQNIFRCITFQLWNCSSAVPLATINQVVEFKTTAANQPTRAANVSVPVPCGVYTCITARDRHHTLRRTLSTAEGFGIVGANYNADFTMALVGVGPVTQNKQLTGGNLNDDNVIDILDFGVYTGQYNKHYDGMGNTGTVSFQPDFGDTSCTTPFPHADISGNGVVFTEDFGFIQANFLLVRDPNCCNAANVMSPGDGPEEPLNPLVRISVRELQARNLHDLIPADLNHDGMLDVADMNAWAQGVRPTPVAAPIPEPVRGTKASSSALRGG